MGIRFVRRHGNAVACYHFSRLGGVGHDVLFGGGVVLRLKPTKVVSGIDNFPRSRSSNGGFGMDPTDRNNGSIVRGLRRFFFF